MGAYREVVKAVRAGKAQNIRLAYPLLGDRKSINFDISDLTITVMEGKSVHVAEPLGHSTCISVSRGRARRVLELLNVQHSGVPVPPATGEWAGRIRAAAELAETS